MRKTREVNQRVFQFQVLSKKVCKLVKLLYGLEQALKQWQEKFNQILVSNTCVINDSDKYISIKPIDATII